MIIRTLEPRQYDWLTDQLLTRAYARPLEASYDVRMEVDGVPYSIRLQPEEDGRIAVLQAFQLERNENELNFELITEDALLSALLELLLRQGVRRKW